jgi:hypothetical protein
VELKGHQGNKQVTPRLSLDRNRRPLDWAALLLVQASNSAAGEPHVWRVARDAHAAMVSSGKNQTIVVSGDSGAGKTESTKLVLQFLTATAGGGAAAAPLARHVVSSNPVLEAFGNAKTVRLLRPRLDDGGGGSMESVEERRAR